MITAAHLARKGSIKYLHKAKNAKNDEFYTVLSDIEKELRHYKNHFKEATVFCNCDDPYESNFFKYFAMNFNFLGLKKLIATCYIGSPSLPSIQLSLFDHESVENKTTRTPHKIEDSEVTDENQDGAVDLADVKYLLKNKKNALSRLKGNGDFRSPECKELLKQADIIVTNPPFSLFREYVGQLLKYDKKFLIIGNWNAISYKEIFKPIKENKIWIGINSNRNFSGFIVPNHYPLNGTEARVDENGNRIVSSNNTCWFTNLDIDKRHEELILYKTYNKTEYPKFDNYDAINVNMIKDIPLNYDGVIGVPVTFINKHNPDQFEIIGEMMTTKVDEFNFGYPYINGQKVYARLLIKKKIM